MREKNVLSFRGQNRLVADYMRRNSKTADIPQINTPKRICSFPKHNLSHTFATEMLRAGVSLPALKELLGHKSLRMTLVYVQVTQDDLQREFHAARLKLEAHRLPLPLLPVTGELNNDPGMTDLFQSMATSRHLLEMYRRQLTEGKLRRKLERLANRLHKVSAELEKLLPEEK